jgi:hypothetical protein
MTRPLFNVNENPPILYIVLHAPLGSGSSDPLTHDLTFNAVLTSLNKMIIIIQYAERRAREPARLRVTGFCFVTNACVRSM